MDLVSLMMTPVVQMTSAKTFHSRGELWGSELSSRLANESDEPRETTSTEYVRTVRLQSEKLWQWIKKSESSSHFDSNSDSISSEDPKIGYRRCCMRSQSSKGSPNEKKEPSIWALPEGGGSKRLPGRFGALMYYQNGDLTNLLKSTRKWSAPECPFEWRGKQSLFGQCPIRGLLCFNGASLKERNHWKLTWKVLKWRPIGHLNSISLINAAFLICTETLAFWPWWSPLPPKSWSTRYNASLKKNCDWSEIKFWGRFGGQFAILEEELKEDLKSDKMFTFVELYWIQQVLVSSINGDIVL